MAVDVVAVGAAPVVEVVRESVVVVPLVVASVVTVVPVAACAVVVVNASLEVVVPATKVNGENVMMTSLNRNKCIQNAMMQSRHIKRKLKLARIQKCP